ncbi:MAG: alpha/beta hydrolase [Deltaproteobacteria bacterium]
MDLRERYIETNGVKLHVMESGPADGPMVLFLHGFPEFWYAWRKQIGYFADRGYLVVVPDQRGYNLSEKPKGIAPYKIDELAKDAIGLADFYKRDKIFLVGHDWGAAVSWWVAIKYPERISRLVVMNVPHTLVFRKHLFGTQKQMEKSWYIFYFQIPGAVEMFASANDFQWPLDLIVESARPNVFSREELEKYREAFKQPGAFSAMVNWYRAALQAPSEQPADYRVKMPVLVLWGLQDIAQIPQSPDESMAFCDNGRLVKFDDCSHWIQHEEAAAINPMIDEFLKEG